jgi:hypothetical protein
MAYEFQNRLLKLRPQIIVLKGFLSPRSQAFEYQKPQHTLNNSLGKLASPPVCRQHTDAMS